VRPGGEGFLLFCPVFLVFSFWGGGGRDGEDDEALPMTWRGPTDVAPHESLLTAIASGGAVHVANASAKGSSDLSTIASSTSGRLTGLDGRDAFISEARDGDLRIPDEVDFGCSGTLHLGSGRRTGRSSADVITSGQKRARTNEDDPRADGRDEAARANVPRARRSV